MKIGILKQLLSGLDDEWDFQIYIPDLDKAEMQIDIPEGDKLTISGLPLDYDFNKVTPKYEEDK